MQELKKEIKSKEGKVEIHISDDCFVIAALYVNNEYRQRGFARRLIEDALVYIDSKNDKGWDVGLWCEPYGDAGMSFKDLLIFYERVGFRKTDYLGWLCFGENGFTAEPPHKGG